MVSHGEFFPLEVYDYFGRITVEHLDDFAGQI